MQFFTRTVYICTALSLSACGGELPPEQDASLATAESRVTSAQSQGCFFNISAYPQGGSPPSYNVVLIRQPTPSCPYGGGNVVLATSLNFMPRMSLAGNALGIAASYVTKSSLSGSSPSVLGLKHVDPATLTTVRSEGLAVYLGLGNVDSGELAIASNGTTLTVTGTKSGVLSGETGSGSNYVATYLDFFTSTTPRTINAY